jgi:hypothetical protein
MNCDRLTVPPFPFALQIDGLNIVQKHAAVRYLARKHGSDTGRDAWGAMIATRYLRR